MKINVLNIALAIILLYLKSITFILFRCIHNLFLTISKYSYIYIYMCVFNTCVYTHTHIYKKLFSSCLPKLMSESFLDIDRVILDLGDWLHFSWGLDHTPPSLSNSSLYQPYWQSSMNLIFQYLTLASCHSPRDSLGQPLKYLNFLPISGIKRWLHLICGGQDIFELKISDCQSESFNITSIL